MEGVVNTAAALMIGSELLSGKVRDENLHHLALTLRALGVRFERALFVKDDIAAIAEEVRALASSYDVVFTSGGVGPTHDDVTIEAVARAFDVPIEANPELESMLALEYGSGLGEGYRRMTLVPCGARLVATKDVRWPTVVMKNVWMLPGVPEVFRMKLLAVKECLLGPGRFFTRALYLQLDEAEIKQHLDATVARFPDVEVGSYPKWFDHSYRTKVTFDARALALASAALEDFLERLPSGEPSRVE